MEKPVELLGSAMAARAEALGLSCTRQPEAPDWTMVGYHQILIVPLPLNLEEAEAAVDEATERAYDRWIISGDGAANIAMFCVAPSEAHEIPQWLPFSAKVERDEAICRKLVWLPGRIPVEGFLDRTMLAQPWAKAVPQGPEQLNALADSLALPRGWMDLLSREDLEGTDLIEALLAVEEESES